MGTREAFGILCFNTDSEDLQRITAVACSGLEAAFTGVMTTEIFWLWMIKANIPGKFQIYISAGTV